MSANRLHDATSPYLQQHADNPVAWWPWCEEALELAKREDKPILLSIGYSACHWCHVMAHESFEDPATAAVMNALYVNIKVDREERPDLDRIYQTAHQLLSRRPGGWPLTVFLTPDDHSPFFAGTYFPPEARHGLPGFTDLLRQIEQAFREQRDRHRHGEIGLARTRRTDTEVHIVLAHRFTTYRNNGIAQQQTALIRRAVRLDHHLHDAGRVTEPGRQCKPQRIGGLVSHDARFREQTGRLPSKPGREDLAHGDFRHRYEPIRQVRGGR